MRPWARSPGARPIVLGHRGGGGARAHAPENTMVAFDRAMADGADGIELDVRTTSDGGIVVMHDVDCARVTGGADVRVVSRMTLAEATSVDLGGGARPPSLADVLDWADARGALVNVELKRDVPARALLARGVARLLRGRARVAARVLVSSFEPRLLAWAAFLARDVPRALLVHAGQRLARTRATIVAARALGAVAIHPERKLCSGALVQAWRKSGLLVNVWTVNEPREAVELSRIGVDGLITDDPALVIGAIDTRDARDTVCIRS